MFSNMTDMLKIASKQMDSFYGVTADLKKYHSIASMRIEKCFEKCANKYYFNERGLQISPYHSVQYAIYLYYLSNTIYRSNGENHTSDQLYCINKAMNCVDWYYAIDLPDVYCAEHPIGSVMGRAHYSDYFFFYQGCTVGGNKGEYPSIGTRVTMYANATIIGKSIIGDNVIVSAGTYIKDQEVPSNCIVFGQSPNLVIKYKKVEEIRCITKQLWK